MTKMHVAMVEHFKKPLVLREWDIPKPGAGEILVKTEFCGVCHTDIHAADGDWPLKPQLPFIPARETICSAETFTGYNTNGAFAEYLLADPNFVARIPAGLSAQEAAPIVCAGVTSYKCIKQTEAKPGEWLAVSGIGGTSMMASWRSRRAWALRSPSMRGPATRPLRSKRRPMEALTVSASRPFRWPRSNKASV